MKPLTIPQANVLGALLRGWNLESTPFGDTWLTKDGKVINIHRAVLKSLQARGLVEESLVNNYRNRHKITAYGIQAYYNKAASGSR